MMKADSARVALRFSLKQAAGTEQDIMNNLDAFEIARQDFIKAVQDGKDRGLSGDSRTVRVWANRPWVALINKGSRISDGLLSSRSVPRRDSKGMEMAYRLFNNSRRMPKDVYKWWAKNEKRIDLLIRGAYNWPEKQEGTDELFKLGRFRIHNTVNAEGAELEALKKAIQRAEKLAKKNPVPGFAKTLYGDLHIVSRLSQAHHAAWYMPGDDSMYLRRGKATGMDEVHALVHELAHRYWKKFADKGAKRTWHHHHWNVGNKDPDFDMPGVGDEIPLKIRGMKERPVVKMIQHGQYFFDTPNHGLQSHPVRDIHKFLLKQNKALKNFPTPYSSKSEEEHFAEAVALSALGILPTEHEKALNEIWG